MGRAKGNKCLISLKHTFSLLHDCFCPFLILTLKPFFSRQNKNKKKVWQTVKHFVILLFCWQGKIGCSSDPCKVGHWVTKSDHCLDVGYKVRYDATTVLLDADWKVEVDNVELNVELYCDIRFWRRSVSIESFIKSVSFVQPISCTTISDRKPGPLTHVLKDLALEITSFHFKSNRLHFNIL